ncbi:capsular polysaccharide biosynthesis protein [Castellaniella caeni]|uniref:capsular polysaccharide biosynthesis protein n=1 Tax=Castellaniella caeni TaxID=266123 RepID=UPI000A0408AA|nr:capsular polysaccharide biosynthesis protein [Castellaniella caeni]
MHIGVFSKGILHNRVIERLLQASVLQLPSDSSGLIADQIAGWGCKQNTRRAFQYASERGLPFLRLEDGFLRSYGVGPGYPQLSLIVDDRGIYYDSTQPSALEVLLQSGQDVLQGLGDQVSKARSLILGHRLSKYNHAPDLPPALLHSGDGGRVLVVDQTVGDVSVSLGGASAQTFFDMLATARRENPGATIYVKTHPEVSSGAKRGYLSNVAEEDGIVLLRQTVNPLDLILAMDRVYVVSSTMGFEALLAEKPVSVFGLPWYAGWGVTDDRQTCPRRTRRRTVDELFAAAYIHYTRYLSPVTHQPGNILDVIDWLVLQKRQAGRFVGRMICVGFRRWKAANLKPLLSLHQERVHFVKDATQAAQLVPGAQDHLVFWGRQPPAGVAALAAQTGARLLHMEDGFVRSVGLGSDMIAPQSLVLDEAGLYFDPTQPSDLENLLQQRDWQAADLQRAESVRQFIVAHGITKYNLEPREPVQWQPAGRLVVLVPGQVEDDASIRFGCTDVRTNLGLLQAARKAHPDAFIVYKPHPDVASGNRQGVVPREQALAYADHLETRCSVISCIEACDVVHTMTSLAGFDALLRHKRVVTYGQPFYAGWGLTEDRALGGVAFARRQRRLTLAQLVAGALLDYPLYWDPLLKGYTTCEAVLNRLVEERDRRAQDGTLDRLNRGWWARNQRKLKALWRAWRSAV